MTEWISYGDRLECGEYREHSRFNKAVNFISPNGTPVSLVTEPIGAGPQNIVILNGNLLSYRALAISEHKIQWDSGDVCRFSDFQQGVYTSHFSHHLPQTINRDIFFENLDSLSEILRETAPDKSLTFLLPRAPKPKWEGAFEQSFAQNAVDAAAHLMTGKFTEGVKKLKGTGFGLTPGGDDFIAGLMVGLHVTQTLCNFSCYCSAHLPVTVEEIFQIAESDNFFSNRFLLYARDGHLFQHFNHLLTALFTAQSSDNAIKAVTQKLYDVGETSGADMCAGFIFCMNLFEQ